VKDSPLIRRGFRLGKELLEQQLSVFRVRVVHFEEISEKTGCEAFYILDCDALTAKKAAVTVEDHTRAGRLFDMDVLRPDGTKVERRELGLEGRKCLLCGNPAQNCARSRAHTVAQLQGRTTELLEEALKEHRSQAIGELATRALLYEVAATPKPGLVDRENSGSHRDMDFFTFQASAAALWPYFARCAAIGMETRELTPGEAFRKLRGPGLVAEGQMLRSTGGVNTHKGAIFSLGILCAAAGRLDEGDPDRILAECARMTAGLTTSDFAGLTPENAKTMGQKLYLRHGITGIRGQAEAGFPAVRDIGLPKLEAGLARGLDLNDAGCAALLAMLTETADTNLIARSDYETQQRIAREIRVLLETEPFPDPQRLRELDRVFVEKNLSPGGTADLLALTYFLYFLKHAQR
jgi:holo-ACP synthase/triphosphoribosyl-dephospho-CoA synthase